MTTKRARPCAQGLLLSAIAAGLLATAGCGFRPVYGTRTPDATPVASDLASIDVALIPDRTGQLLRNELSALLNPAGKTGVADRYTLAVRLRENVDTFAVERSGFATRATVELIAAYTLQEDTPGTQVLAGRSRAISSYNLLDNDFSTVVGADDARRRAVQQLAYDIRNRLAAHFATTNAAAAATPAEGQAPQAPLPGPLDEPLTPGAPIVPTGE
jgi:LPS-assembly lipoprotein